MIALDTNLLVYAYREDSEFHTTAVEQLRPVVEGDSPWALPWTCVHEFIGVVTSGRVYKPASPLSNNPAVKGLGKLLIARRHLAEQFHTGFGDKVWLRSNRGVHIIFQRLSGWWQDSRRTARPGFFRWTDRQVARARIARYWLARNID